VFQLRGEFAVTIDKNNILILKSPLFHWEQHPNASFKLMKQFLDANLRVKISVVQTV